MVMSSWNPRCGQPVRCVYLFVAGLLVLELVLPSIVRATNGLNLIDSGGISTALAGADTAVATDFSAMNTNPAGMSQIADLHIGGAIGILQGKIRHEDALNAKDSVNGPLIIPNVGVIKHLRDTPFTLGL